jgi:hypothetical protein
MFQDFVNLSRQAILGSNFKSFILVKLLPSPKNNVVGFGRGCRGGFPPRQPFL